MLPDSSFWQGKRVFLTGHTGFKGAWLGRWLERLGCTVAGYALDPPSTPSLWALLSTDSAVVDTRGDVRDRRALSDALADHAPEVVFHLAAQSLVRPSYDDPVGTYETNVMGTVHLLDAVRHTPSVRVMVNVTSDKCYQNREWVWGYRECDPMGGHDPYSNSKGCAELITAAFRDSFFDGRTDAPAVASARAGNVIGGGDWAIDRLVPDIIKSVAAGESVAIRSPHSIRPWQHVLEPVSAYLKLAERLWSDPEAFVGGWNIGPAPTDVRPVSYIVEALTRLWGEGASWKLDPSPSAHEAHYLKLDTAKATDLLSYRPELSLGAALEWSVAWYKAHHQSSDMCTFTDRQISDYQGLCKP